MKKPLSWGTVTVVLFTAAATWFAPHVAAAQEATATDLLESSGIDEELLNFFVDGRPPAQDDWNAQIGVMVGLRQVTQLDLDRYAVEPTDPQALGDAGRGKLWRVTGILKSIEPRELKEEEWRKLYGEVDEMPEGDPRRFLYDCLVQLDGGLPKATVVAMSIPKQLVGRANLDERVGIEGLLVKNAGSDDSPRPVIFARRLAWYPRNFLGNLGMDFALFDDVRPVARDLKRERECFYQLLATMKKADMADLYDHARVNFDPDAGRFVVYPLFGTQEQPNLPETMVGKLVTLVGTARRAVAVVVDDADIQERFGIKKYYEVSIYTPDSQQNPLIVNLLELPAGFPEGENIHQPVQMPAVYLTGFFYSREATPDEQTRGIDPKLQKAPLLIGKSLDLAEPVEIKDDMFEWLFGASVAAAFAVLAVAVWRLMRGERKTREILQRQMQPEAGTSLNDVDVEVQPAPDFSGLNVETPKDDAEAR